MIVDASRAFEMKRKADALAEDFKIKMKDAVYAHEGHISPVGMQTCINMLNDLLSEPNGREVLRLADALSRKMKQEREWADLPV